MSDIEQDAARYRYLRSLAVHGAIGGKGGVVLHYEGPNYSEINMPAAKAAAALDYSLLFEMEINGKAAH